MNKELIQKYLDGKCTALEEAEVSAYLKGDDLSELHAYIDELDAEAKDELSLEEKEAELALLHLELRKRHKLKKLPFRRLSVAASIAAVVMLSAGGLYWSMFKERKEVQAASWITFTNPANKVKRLTMPDGSSIWLNENSTLSYNNAAYNKNNREVRIVGEAYFDVAHDADRPFIVHAGKLTTTVLGTAFNIEAYANEKQVKVILVRGKVRVNSAAEDRIMKPGQMLSFRKDKSQLDVTEVATEGISNWTSGKFVFSNLPLTDVLSRIERAYGIQISYTKTDAINDMTLTGTYPRSSPEELLKKILFIHGLHFKKEGEQYHIKP